MQGLLPRFIPDPCDLAVLLPRGSASAVVLCLALQSTLLILTAILALAPLVVVCFHDGEWRDVLLPRARASLRACQRRLPILLMSTNERHTETFRAAHVIKSFHVAGALLVLGVRSQLAATLYSC